MTEKEASAEAGISIGDCLVIALWTGIVGGWGEAITTWALRNAPTINAYRKAGLEVVWVAPLAYTLLFFIGALILAGALRLVGRRVRYSLVFSIAAAFAIGAAIGYPKVLHIVALVLLCAGFGAVLYRAIVPNEQAFRRTLRRNTPWLVLAAVLIPVAVLSARRISEARAVQALPAPKPGSPNVVVIVIDALRGDRLSSAGYTRHTTPNIDRLAQESAQYFNAWSTAPWTAPSHETMLTGRYSFEHHVDYPVPYVRNPYPKLPRIMEHFGYRTALISANLGPATEEYLQGGFQHVATYTAWMTLSRLTLLRGLRGTINKLVKIDFPPPKRASVGRKQLLDWADRHGDRPFFALVNFVDVHDHVNPEWRLPSEFENRFGDVSRRRRKDKTVTFDDVGLYYDASLAYEDDQIGKLLQDLKSRGLEDNTVIIVTADHGEAIGEHGDDGHNSSLYREQLHVPLVIHAPGKVRPGTRVSAAVSLASLPSTVLALAGLPPQLPGDPFPLSDSVNAPNRPPLLAEFSTLRRGQVLKALIDDHWHYILNVQTGAEELFDLTTDATELHNVAGSPGNRPVLEGFRARLRQLFPNGFKQQPVNGE